MWNSLARFLGMRPRSFSGLIFACLILVVVPLAIPLLYVAESMNQLSKQGQQMVRQMEQIAHYTKILSNRSEKMERGVKLARILNDASLLGSYHENRAKFRGALSGLAALQLTPDQGARLEKVDAAEIEIFRTVANLADAHKAPATLRVDFSDLRGAVHDFLKKNDVSVERKMDMMQAMTDEVSRVTIWLAALMVPLAILLAASTARLITAPIQQISAAIEAMGTGELSRGVKIDGPQDLQRLGERVEWLRISLLELEKQKTTFLRHVSHELKTPLTSIREGAGLLSEGIAGELTDKQMEIAAILYANSLQLQKQIEDLLNFNALQTGKTVLACKRLALCPLIEGVIQDHRLALDNKGLTVDLACPALDAYADEQKLRIIVDNLLSNAVKYSAPGGVIEVSAAAIGGSICIDVADCGRGVAIEDSEKIFDAFYQGRNPPRGGTVKGTGLGLAIAREYAEAHGGRLQLVEQIDVTRFRVSLPGDRAATST